MLNFARAALVSTAIAVAALLLIEGTIRLVGPQDVRTSYLSGRTLGLKDPVLGHINNPGAHARVRAPEFDVEYRISEQGFREERIYGAKPDPSVTRILLLGDSFTFGATSTYEEIWPVLLRRKLAAAGKKAEVINAGVPGSDTAQQALYLERLYDELRPDVVVVGFLPNDLFTIEPIRSADGVDRAGGGSPLVVRKNNEKKSDLHSVTLIKRMLMESDALYLQLYRMTSRRDFFQEPPSPLFRHKVAVFKEILTRMHEFCDERGAKLVVLSVPQLFQVLLGAEDGPDASLNARLPDEAFEDFARTNGILWVSALDPLIRQHEAGGPRLYHRFDGHFTAAGNAVVSDVAFRALAPLVSGGPTLSSQDPKTLVAERLL